MKYDQVWWIRNFIYQMSCFQNHKGTCLYYKYFQNETVHTFFRNEHARMIKEEISERVALLIKLWLTTQTRWLEKREQLKSSESGLTLCHSHCWARHCNTKISVSTWTAIVIKMYLTIQTRWIDKLEHQKTVECEHFATVTDEHHTKNIYTYMQIVNCAR